MYKKMELLPGRSSICRVLFSLQLLLTRQMLHNFNKPNLDLRQFHLPEHYERRGNPTENRTWILQDFVPYRQNGRMRMVAAQVRSSWNTLIPYMEEIATLMQEKLDNESVEEGGRSREMRAPARV